MRAAAALAALGDADGRAYLRARAGARRDDVRALVIQALGEIGDEWATGLLRELHNSVESEELQEMIEDALARVLRGDVR